MASSSFSLILFILQPLQYKSSTPKKTSPCWVITRSLGKLCCCASALLVNLLSLGLPDENVFCRELFVDGTDANGKRVYDKLNGMTCHQCRQKTLGKHTSCSCCNSLQVSALATQFAVPSLPLLPLHTCRLPQTTLLSTNAAYLKLLHCM